MISASLYVPTVHLLHVLFGRGTLIIVRIGYCTRCGRFIQQHLYPHERCYTPLFRASVPYFANRIKSDIPIDIDVVHDMHMSRPTLL